MKPEKNVRVSQAFLLALLSFFVYLFTYAAFLLTEAAFGGGQAYLFYLMFAPVSFVCYTLFVGALGFRISRTVLPHVLWQSAAFFLYFLVSVSVDFLSQRAFFGEGVFFNYSGDLLAIFVCPVTVLCGARVMRAVLRRREEKTK